jgi:hypothetical protein
MRPPDRAISGPRFAAGSRARCGSFRVHSLDFDELSRRDSVAGSQFPLDLERLNYAFNPKWLRSPDAHFQLVGAVNRLDMRSSTPKECGQIGSRHSRKAGPWSVYQ